MEKLQELKQDSIHILRSTTVYWPIEQEERILDVSVMRAKFNGESVFSTNNSTLAYIDDEGVFVTPYTRRAMAILGAAGFTREYFYVPFSNGDYPKYEKVRWEHLRDIAKASYLVDYEEDCKKWCDGHHINELSSETMGNCFRIPREGVPVKHQYYETTVYPACNERCVDCTVVDRLGTFSANNGVVAFVYRDGHTYVTKGYRILGRLRAVGFKEGGLFVPFSNGEQIMVPYLAQAWANITR